MKYETRVLTVGDLEVRQLEDGRREYRGYAIRFGDWSANLGGFVERVAPEAVKRTLGESADVRHMINHDPNLVLGRTTSGTTRLEADDAGVLVVTDMPDTSYARDLAVSIERGDITQMSFGFNVPKGGDSWDWSKSPAERTLLDIDLADVSTVTYPAYSSTTAEVRSLVRKNLRAAVGPAVVAWDDEASMCDYLEDISASLPDTGSAWGYCADCTTDGTEALVTWYEGGACQVYVVPVALDADGEPAAGPIESWTPVTGEWVVDEDAARAMRSFRAIELRAGKALSKANAEHVAAIAEHSSAMAEHVSALAEAAGVPDAEGGADDNDTNDDTAERAADRRRVYAHMIPRDET